MSDHTYFREPDLADCGPAPGPYRPPQYERVMLPMPCCAGRLRACADKVKVLAEYKRGKAARSKATALDRLLNKAAGQRFHNHSPLDFEKLKGDPDNIEKHLVSYIKGFSSNVRDIFDFFEFENEIERMREANNGEKYSRMATGFD